MIELIGKNGSGKNYLANRLIRYGFNRYVGYTTRLMRYGEQDGIDYHFIDRFTFLEKLNNGEFQDYKVLNNNYYGIEKYENLSNNTIVIGGKIRDLNLRTNHYIPIFIDADFNIRYERVMKRNYDIQTVFNRFHTENFAYLFDFDAIFINNNYDGLDEILENVNTDGNIKTTDNIISNKSFIENKINNYSNNFDQRSNIISFLRFEENCLRNIFISNLTEQEFKIKYFEEIKKYLQHFDYNYHEFYYGYEITDSNDDVFKVKYLRKK